MTVKFRKTVKITSDLKDLWLSFILFLGGFSFLGGWRDDHTHTHTFKVSLGFRYFYIFHIFVIYFQPQLT